MEINLQKSTLAMHIVKYSRVQSIKDYKGSSSLQSQGLGEAYEIPWFPPQGKMTTLSRIRLGIYEKVEKKINWWYNRWICLGEVLTFIKSVLEDTPIFWLLMACCSLRCF